MDLETHAKTLPTEQDFEACIKHIEYICIQCEILQLKEDIGAKLEDIEQTKYDIPAQVTNHELTLQEHATLKLSICVSAMYNFQSMEKLRASDLKIQVGLFAIWTVWILYS